MRCDQYFGLNQAAQALISGKQIKVGHYEKWFNDGRPNEKGPIIESSVKQEPSGNVYHGAFDEQENALWQYTLPDGRVLREFVQAKPWSSGPCFFLALEEEKLCDDSCCTGMRIKAWHVIKESLWPEDEINNV